jgi:hypothetical protein
VRTLLDTALTGTEIQIWIEVRLCELGSDHAAKVAGNVEYVGLGALVPALGRLFRTSPRPSGGVAVVVLQHAALAFAALDRACATEVLRRRRDELVAQALVVSLSVVMIQEILNRGPKVSLAEYHHLVQTFGFYGEDKSFGKGIQVWALRRQLHKLHAALSEQLLEAVGEQRIAIQDQVALVPQEAVHLVDEVSADCG